MPVPRCQDAVNSARYTVRFLENRNGLRVRLVEMQSPLGAEAPVWLHVHGITSSWLHGLRYRQPAGRLGFRLFMVELVNHGGSQRVKGGSTWGCQEKWDVIAALEEIARLYPRAPVLVSATSMGTLVVTEAALEQPAVFDPVRGVVFESPVPDLRALYDIFEERAGWLRPVLPSWKTMLSMTRWRSDTDLSGCFRQDNRASLPLLTFLSREEFPDPRRREEITRRLRFSRVETVVLSRGRHNAYWNYQPRDFEEHIRRFFSAH